MYNFVSVFNFVYILLEILKKFFAPTQNRVILKSAKNRTPSQNGFFGKKIFFVRFYKDSFSFPVIVSAFWSRPRSEFPVSMDCKAW